MPRYRVPGCFHAAGLLAAIWSSAAEAQSIPAQPAPTGPISTASPGDPGFTTQLFSSSRSTLLGDMWGLRPALGALGISFGAQEISEVFGNATGGLHRGADYNGLTLVSLGLDTGKAFGWSGGTFSISALQIHGRSVSADNLGLLDTVSGIEAQRATRLWEAWFQQVLLDGKLDVKIGQQSLDQEFITSAGSSLFLNTMAGWPLIPSVDLYAGGPAYPLSSLGVRLRAQPMDNVTILAGVFNDNPAGGSFNDDSQVRGAAQSGTAFNFNTGALAIAEIQYALNQPTLGQMDYGKGAGRGLPGTYRLGAWFDSAAFPDQRFDGNGLSLANPASSGTPRMHRNNWSVYGVFDQMIWRSAPDDPRSLSIFARLMGAPDDRNQVDFSVNAGITLKAPLPGRQNDTVGIGYGLAKLSDHLSELDADAAAYDGTGSTRSTESFIEVTYQAQIAPWLAVQPDFQYFFTPSGGVPNPNEPGHRIGNEAVLGLRTNITF